MKKLLGLLCLFVLFCSANAYGDCNVSFNQVIDTEAEHISCYDDGWYVEKEHISHFSQTWVPSGGWNGTEGYMRWTITQTFSEESDGYTIVFPAIEDTPYISYIMRVGSTWAQHHVGDEWKHTAFKNTADGTDRPMMFARTLDMCGDPQYGFFYMATDANGDGLQDEFDETGDWCQNHPNHTYKELVGTAHTQWYFVVVGIEGTLCKSWIWSQDGTLEGFYADSADTGSWDVPGWHRAHLFYYVESTTAGDANSYMDVSHIMVSQTLPSPPDGFLGSTPEPPSATGCTIQGGSFR